MPFNHFAGNEDRRLFRQRAWRNIWSDGVVLIGLALATTSLVLSVVRSNISEDSTENNWLFGFEFATFCLSLGLDYWINVTKIENLRILHAQNSALRPDGYRQGNGLIVGISLPSNVAFGVGVGFGMASLAAFFSKQSMISSVFGALAPAASNFANNITRSRYDQEEAALVQITGSSVEDAEAGGARNDCGMLAHIASCGRL